MWAHRVSFSFLPKGAQNEIVWIIGGRQVHIHVQSMWQTRGSKGMLPQEILILNLLFDVIWWKSGTNLPVIKASIKS